MLGHQATRQISAWASCGPTGASEAEMGDGEMVEPMMLRTEIAMVVSPTSLVAQVLLHLNRRLV
jgi:hypothetical protein